MTAGISLLESPARFTAPTITRPVALDVGRVVFTILNRAELISLLLLLVVVRLSGRAREFWAGCSVLALILIAQTVWLLPELSARSQQIVAGIEPPGSMIHASYAALELVKLALLLYLGFKALHTSEPPAASQDHAEPGT